MDGQRNHGDVVSDVFDMLDLYGLETPTNDIRASFAAKQTLNWVKEEFEELVEAVAANDHDAIKAECVDLIWVALNVMRQICQGDKDEALRYFKAIYLANLSKTCKSLEDAKQTVALYESGNHPQKNGVAIPAFHRKSKDRYIICRIQDGKILKGMDFKKYQHFLQ